LTSWTTVQNTAGFRVLNANFNWPFTNYGNGVYYVYVPNNATCTCCASGHQCLTANVGTMPSDPNVDMVWTLAITLMQLDQDERFRSAPPEIQQRIQSDRERSSAEKPRLSSEKISAKK